MQILNELRPCKPPWPWCLRRISFAGAMRTHGPDILRSLELRAPSHEGAPVGLNNRWNYRTLPRAVAGPIRSPCVVLT